MTLIAPEAISLLAEGLWPGLSPLRVAVETTEPWWRTWLDFGLQVATIVAGLLIVVWQASRQYRDNLRLQAENQRNDYRRKLHEGLAAAIAEASGAVVAATGWDRGVLMELRMREVSRQLGVASGPTRHRATEGIALRGAAHNAQEIDDLQRIADESDTEFHTLGAYLSDLAVEAQNHLVVPLFGGEAKHRQPKDEEQYRVIRRDRAAELEPYLRQRDPHPGGWDGSDLARR